ncbi:hypothetical protein A3K64_02405 [Candidatus Micrarchaeota archaeon RBG_16_36_9]|nr:MAG: hypothetical protein A3K64_02405 [Candidatus Micrarchaeota archaeon RBG_16_36_9]
MSIFRAYDIRGLYGKDLTDEIAEKIAKAFVNLLHAKKAVVGMDVRTASPQLKESVIKGLVSQGCDVIDIGLVPIPAFYFFIVKYKLKAGIYVTGSHDPKGYDGLKLCKAKAIDLTYESGIGKLEKNYKKNYPEKKNGVIVKEDVSDEYEKHIIGKFKIRPLEVVIDAGNGCLSYIAPDVFEKLGFDVTRLFCEFDGNFPNRPPEPLEKNLTALKNKVKEVKADLGIAYDVDGDRSIFIDDKGEYVNPDIILTIFAENLLKKNDTLVVTVACTKVLETLAKKFKWKLVWTRVGRSYVKQEMIRTKATLAGEISGHYFFKENNYDDGLFTSLVLAKLIGEKGNLSYLKNRVSRHASLDLRIDCKEEKKNKVVKAVKMHFKKHKLILIDGVGINFKNGFALVRPSNTEEKIEIKLEADNESDLVKIRKEIEDIIKDV